MAGKKKTASAESPEITLFSAVSTSLEKPVTIDIEKTFETLDTIISQMESPGITLETSLSLYKQAVTLASGMKTKLEHIRAEIDTISEEGA